MNWLKIVSLTAFNIFLIGCGSAIVKRATSDPAGSPATSAAANSKEQEMFVKNCVVCHQPSGEGGTIKLEDGTKLKVPSLKADRTIRHSDKDYYSQISKGGDGMPAFKEKLSEVEINNLIRFIRRDIQGNVTPK
jgi:mono/diheme cytochrome c family protein